MISVIKQMVYDRGYKPDASTVECGGRMGPYVGQHNSLVVLMARDFVNNRPFGIDKNALTKKDILNFTLNYYRSIEEDVMEFATIVVIPSDTLDASILEGDISAHGMTVFTEDELMFNPTHSNLTSRHCLALDIELQEMKEKGISYDSLPKVCTKDCMCKWYGFKEGEVIRIEREYCNEVYYRIVI